MPADTQTDSETAPEAPSATDADVVTTTGGPTDPAAVDPAAPAARRTKPDAALAAAVDVARIAAQDVAEDAGVGDHLGVVGEGERVVTHTFACTSTGYRGWQWAVTLARAPRSRSFTVSEVNLLPGPGAVLSPQWLPWADRLAPGDLSPGDVLPRLDDDPRLELGFEATGDEDVDSFALWELGLGRPRVLSREGREDAAARWYDGTHGPRDPHAEQASAACSTCGFFVPMAGALRQVFGVCANEWSPADGQVVSLDHGCGAHSEVDVERRPEQLDAPVLDELGYLEVALERSADEPAPAADAPAADAPAGDAPTDHAPTEDPSSEDAPER